MTQSAPAVCDTRFDEIGRSPSPQPSPARGEGVSPLPSRERPGREAARERGRPQAEQDKGQRPLGRLACGLVRFYQRAISPALPGACRFQPSCSEYCVEAIERHGVRRGAYLTLRRIGRCHPFHEPGYDPVP